MKTTEATRTVPFFRARKMARTLLGEIDALQAERTQLKEQLTKLGALTVIELEGKKVELEREIATQAARLQRERAEAAEAVQAASYQLQQVRQTIVETEDLTLLQEAGIYKYRHPLTDAVAYQKELAKIDELIKAMTRKDGGAVLATTSWTVNGSAAQGRTMVRDFSKLMLRAFNAEADNLSLSVRLIRHIII